MAGRQDKRNDEDESEDESTWGDVLMKVGKFALRTAVVATTLVFAAKAVLPAVGFGKEGVIADTPASRYQSRSNPIEKGSVFAKLQRAGAKEELPDGTVGGIIAASAAAVGALTLLKK